MIGFDVAFLFVSEIQNNRSLNLYLENLLDFNDFKFWPIADKISNEFNLVFEPGHVLEKCPYETDNGDFKKLR